MLSQETSAARWEALSAKRRCGLICRLQWNVKVSGDVQPTPPYMLNFVLTPQRREWTFKNDVWRDVWSKLDDCNRPNETTAQNESYLRRRLKLHRLHNITIDLCDDFTTP